MISQNAGEIQFLFKEELARDLSLRFEWYNIVLDYLKILYSSNEPVGMNQLLPDSRGFREEILSSHSVLITQAMTWLFINQTEELHIFDSVTALKNHERTNKIHYSTYDFQPVTYF